MLVDLGVVQGLRADRLRLLGAGPVIGPLDRGLDAVALDRRLLPRRAGQCRDGGGDDDGDQQFPHGLLHAVDRESAVRAMEAAGVPELWPGKAQNSLPAQSWSTN